MGSMVDTSRNLVAPVNAPRDPTAARLAEPGLPPDLIHTPYQTHTCRCVYVGTFCAAPMATLDATEIL